MKSNLRRLLCVAIVAMLSVSAYAQGTLTGKVIDQTTKEGLIGATVAEVGTTNGAITAADGSFKLTLKSGSPKISISYIGYVSVLKTVEIKDGQTVNIGEISLSNDAVNIEELVVVGNGVIDIAKDRETPVAMSTIPVTEIQTKTGNQEFPEVMKNTPSVYVGDQAKGYGDATLNVRGFDQNNIAVLFNGQPVNGMEDGNIYWSNWQGISDIANAIQIQRGLGSSKLAISSVGATVNIVTKATDAAQAGRVSALAGNDAYMKYTASYSTGLNEKGWGMSVLLSHWQGDGYNDGTSGQGQTYFFSVGYKPSESHSFNLSITGAPQWHDQNYTKTLSSYDRNGDGDISNSEQRYNDNWGYLNGKEFTWRKNFYHKPVVNFNWDWTIDDKSALSTVAYLSTGTGGGTGAYGSSSNAYIYDSEGQVDFTQIYNNNRAIDSSTESYNVDGKVIGKYSNSALRRSSMNIHRWMGIVSNYNRTINEHWSFNAGMDLRTYFGEHYQLANNYLGLDGYYDDFYNYSGGAALQHPNGYVYTNSYKASPYPWGNHNKVVDQKLGYSNNERISYGGVFGQVEYKTEKLSAFAQGALSTQSYQRFDYFTYIDPKDQESEKLSEIGYNIKAGGNYNINKQHNVFVNAGYYSRQPYFDNMFLNYSNEVNEEVGNEGILGLEVGYGFRSRYFDADVNAYYTEWTDRQIREGGDYDGDGVVDDVALFENVAELHTGVEVEFVARPITHLELKGFASIGNWKYDGDVNARFWDEDRNPISGIASTLYLDDVKVGDAAQFTFGLTADYKITEALSIDADYRYYDKLYAAIDPSSFDTADNEGSLELPSYGLLDMGLSYFWSFKNNDLLKFRVNVNNLTNKQYIVSSDTNIHAAEGDATWEGVNTDNKVFFGNGITWNIGLTYSF